MFLDDNKRLQEKIKILSENLEKEKEKYEKIQFGNLILFKVT